MNDICSQLLTILSQGIEESGLCLNETQRGDLLIFLRLLLKWNKVYNLTAINDPEKMITHHILDSLSVVPYIRGPRVIDVGTGAGFPGIPCALALPEIQFTLLDSNGKKTRFITQVIGELKIKNAKVINDRVENYKPEKCFDNVMARAFSSLEKTIALSRHLICPKGEFLLMRGICEEEQLQKINKHAKVYKLSVPGLQEERHLVCIKGLLHE